MKISKGTVIRTVVLAVALLNQGLVLFGKNPLPVADETVAALISWLFTAVSAIIGWWKNNSFTKEALAADEYLGELRGVQP